MRFDLAIGWIPRAPEKKQLTTTIAALIVRSGSLRMLHFKFIDNVVMLDFYAMNRRRIVRCLAAIEDIGRVQCSGRMHWRERRISVSSSPSEPMQSLVSFLAAKNKKAWLKVHLSGRRHQEWLCWMDCRGLHGPCRGRKDLVAIAKVICGGNEELTT